MSNLCMWVCWVSEFIIDIFSVWFRCRLLVMFGGGMTMEYGGLLLVGLVVK